MSLLWRVKLSRAKLSLHRRCEQIAGLHLQAARARKVGILLSLFELVKDPVELGLVDEALVVAESLLRPIISQILSEFRCEVCLLRQRSPTVALWAGQGACARARRCVDHILKSALAQLQLVTCRFHERLRQTFSS